jgi:hypothetical protein
MPFYVTGASDAAFALPCWPVCCGSGDTRPSPDRRSVRPLKDHHFCRRAAARWPASSMTRSSFPTDEAARKLLFLAIRNAGIHWRRTTEMDCRSRAICHSVRLHLYKVLERSLTLFKRETPPFASGLTGPRRQSSRPRDRPCRSAVRSGRTPCGKPGPTYKGCGRARSPQRPAHHLPRAPPP